MPECITIRGMLMPYIFKKGKRELKNAHKIRKEWRREGFKEQTVYIKCQFDRRML